MKHFLLIVLLFYSFSSFSQARLTGTVLDKETSKPIANAVIYSSDYQYSTMTDENGNYELNVADSAIIHFEQLAYHPLSISTDSLSLNPDVNLARNVYELKAVEISPIDAEELLNKAIRNLYEREERKKTRDYLCHLREQTSNGGVREAYALFDATLKSVDLKKGKYNRDFRLTKLDRLKNENGSYFNLRKRKPFSIELFPQQITTQSDLHECVCELQDKNENELIIKLSPKTRNEKFFKYSMFTINKEDSVLIQVEAQSFPNSAELSTKSFKKGITYQHVNHYFKMSYSQDKSSNLYYFDKLIHLGTIRISSDSIYDLSFHETLTFTGESIPQKEQKKIKPFNYVLYETKAPETKGFWKEYQ